MFFKSLQIFHYFFRVFILFEAFCMIYGTLKDESSLYVILPVLLLFIVILEQLLYRYYTGMVIEINIKPDHITFITVNDRYSIQPTECNKIIEMKTKYQFILSCGKRYYCKKFYSSVDRPILDHRKINNSYFPKAEIVKYRYE